MGKRNCRIYRCRIPKCQLPTSKPIDPNDRIWFYISPPRTKPASWMSFCGLKCIKPGKWVGQAVLSSSHWAALSGLTLLKQPIHQGVALGWHHFAPLGRMEMESSFELENSTECHSIHRMNAVEIKKMSVSQRLEVMEEIWDTLCHETVEISSPIWHGKILEGRKKKMDSGDANFLTLDQVRSRFRR